MNIYKLTYRNTLFLLLWQVFFFFSGSIIFWAFEGFLFMLLMFF